MKVVKFGGTSLATASNVSKCKDIVLSDEERRFVVVSAPGKRDKGDIKVTDLLLNISERFPQDYRDYILSRGEHLMAMHFADVVGYTFLDAQEYIVIKDNGDVNLKKTQENFSKLDPSGCYVMGGFFGASEGKHDYGYRVKTFARGGSDYSGAIASVCLNAEVYEVFTDTYGVMTADPNFDVSAVTITEMTYDALYDMALDGAQVIFANCLPLLKRHRVPLKVDNTFDPNKKYTYVHI